MTLPPDLPDAPFGADTDEALNAFLDGELSAFAVEHGTTAADARDRLEQWPGFADRVAALEQARTAAGTPVPPLDDLTRHRLVRGALPAPSRRRGGRTWLTAAAAVAVVLLVAGIVATLVRSGDDTGTDLRSSSRAAPEPRQGDLGDVGDVTDPASLRALLDPAGAKRPTRSGEEAAGGVVKDEAPAAPNPVDPNACARRIAGTRPVRFVGRGTYRGRPVVVAGITAGQRTIVLVVPADDCSSVLTSLSR